jgi:hypothetical protein
VHDVDIRPPWLGNVATAMKYGIIFCTTGAMLAFYAVFSRGFWLIVLHARMKRL